MKFAGLRMIDHSQPAARPHSGCQRKTCNLVKTTVNYIISMFPQLFYPNLIEFANYSRNSGPERRVTGSFV